MEIEVGTEEDRAVLTLKGDVTNAGDLPVLQETVNDLLRKGVHHFTLNLEAVQYVDSAGLDQLVRLTKLLERPEKKNFFMELPEPFGTRLPLLTPLIWLALVVTFAVLVLVTIASRASFSFW